MENFNLSKRQEETTSGSQQQLQRPPHIWAEANFLRLPLFALATKNLKDIEFIEVAGTKREKQDDDSYDTWDFKYKASRNISTQYPGILSRKVHLAFLGMITEHGLPFQNPLIFGWRDLCRRIDMSCSGTMVKKVKKALLATKGLMIYSTKAIRDKANDRWTSNSAAIGIYDDVQWINQDDAKGGRAECNKIWFSNWYLDSINNYYTAKLDQELWKTLDGKCHIASRIYEFLMIKMWGRRDQPLDIGYVELAQHMPVKINRNISKAKQQFDQAFEALSQQQLVGDVKWLPHAHEVAMLRIDRGINLLHKGSGKTPEEIASEPVTPEKEVVITKVTTHYATKKPEYELVIEFYELWSPGNLLPPSKSDLAKAKEAITVHGEVKVRKALPLVVKRLKEAWPECKTFTGFLKYLPEVVNAQAKRQREEEHRQAEAAKRKQADDEFAVQKAAEEEFVAKWQPIWDTLPPQEKQRIELIVVADKGRQVKYIKSDFHRYCLQELEKKGEPAVQLADDGFFGDESLRQTG